MNDNSNNHANKSYPPENRFSDQNPSALIDPQTWLRTQAVLSAPMAEAAMAVGRLDATLAGIPTEARNGTIQRLALIEVEEMLWAQGTPLRREEIGQDLMDARASSDLDAMRQARWAIRRLEGQGGLTKLRDFLGLRQGDGFEPHSGPSEGPNLRPSGANFDAAAADFLKEIEPLSGLHPLIAAVPTRIVWRLSELSPPDQAIEAAVWTARQMAVPCEALTFVPLGRHGRAVWNDSGSADDRLTRHLSAVTEGANDARAQIRRIAEWEAQAKAAVAHIKGENPARVIATLAAHPLMSAAMVESATGVSRITAERLLARMQELGLIREITGTKRFRLWMAAAG